jgi:hypothetical protein
VVLIPSCINNFFVYVYVYECNPIGTVESVELCRVLLMLAHIFAFFCEFVSCAGKLCSITLFSPQLLVALCDAPYVRSNSKVAMELFLKALLRGKFRL